ncbi:hypothetical protein [Marilutibacter maris]|uniref:hypothetical protein n=1 Tax=Marilutibacter maris TaxID=1605891 RepID=UPI0011AEB603|nr:hypothetical protein [Lysobacter maris]
MFDEKRLELAFERLKAENWRLFERYASAFFSSEFPSLRTMASPSGDDGRDAEIFSPDGRPEIALQYSVASDWRAKINRTIARLKETKKLGRILIYATSQQVGAAADDLKAKLLLDECVVLDVRDRSYFLERFRQDVSRAEISEALAREMVDPLLQSKGIIERKAQALSEDESRAALVFLELQWEDESRDKGLTKISFEALVRSALRDTSSENPMDLAEIYRRVCGMVPEHDTEFALREVDKALRRLDKTVIRHYQKEERYCLSNEEVMRIRDRLVDLEIQESTLNSEIHEVFSSLANAESPNVNPDLLVVAARAAIERFLMERGESFVDATATGLMVTLSAEDLKRISREEVAKTGVNLEKDSGVLGFFMSCVERLLENPTPGVSNYLRRISDAYTLRAFLRQTPDVQAAVRKMFSFGEIWLDTSFILPMFGEALLPRADRNFIRLAHAAVNAGLTLRVSPGVIEEVERHMNRARVCASTPSATWQGQIPYLLSIYVYRGYDPALFSDWLNKFAGEYRPEDDLAEYLLREFKISRTEIEEDARRASSDLRLEVQRIWQNVHEERSKRQSGRDPLVALRMAEHDVENYVGVIYRRNRDRDSAIGYTSWWLTLDSKAFLIAQQLPQHVLGKHQSPVMSADFLANYLAVGPLRAANAGESMPLVIDDLTLESIDRSLFDLASDIRAKNSGQPEVLVRRMVRDALDKARRRIGEVHSRGLEFIVD